MVEGHGKECGEAWWDALVNRLKREPWIAGLIKKGRLVGLGLAAWLH